MNIYVADLFDASHEFSAVRSACLNCCASRTGASTSTHDKALQQKLLQRVLSSWAPHEPAVLILQASLVLCSISIHRGSCSSLDWLQPGRDTHTLQQRLDALARGKLLIYSMPGFSADVSCCSSG